MKQETIEKLKELARIKIEEKDDKIVFVVDKTPTRDKKNRVRVKS